MHFPDTEVFILLGAINSGWKYYAAAPKKKYKILKGKQKWFMERSPNMTEKLSV